MSLVAHWARSISTEEATVTTNSEPGLPSEWVSDKVDLDELFHGAKPIGDGRDWILPGFFATDEEFAEFQAWLKAERATGLA
jgi:hypothetical protein